MTGRPSRAAQVLLVLALVYSVTSLASDRLRSPMFGIDDANIFFVYARSVSAGEGFVFNPGSERVEGFTSFLWVMICSAAMAVAGDPERYLLALNILLVTLTIACCLRSFVFRAGTGIGSTALPWASAFLILLLMDFRYVAWNTVTLMETALWTCLLTTTTILVVEGRSSWKHTSVLAVLVTLLILTRPEALVWVPVLCGLFYVRRAASGERSQALSVVPALLAFVLTTLLLTMFRLLYFGLPLPNTYYAKVSPSLSFSLHEGGRYLGQYLVSGPVPFACALAILFSVVHLLKVRFRDERTLALTVPAVAGLTLPVLTGGDHFSGFRFYQSVYPLLLLALLNFARFIVPKYVAVPSHKTNIRRIGAAALIAVVLALQIVEWTLFDTGGLQAEFEIAAVGRQQGHRINLLFDNVRPLPKIGTISVGGLKYAYHGHVIDLMGLNNTKMAHNGGNRVGLRSHAAFERRTFYELKPTIVVPLAQHSLELRLAEQRVPFIDTALKGILQEAGFRDIYRLAEVRKTTPAGTAALAAWYDRKFLSDLARSGKFEIQFADERGHQ